MTGPEGTRLKRNLVFLHEFQKNNRKIFGMYETSCTHLAPLICL